MSHIWRIFCLLLISSLSFGFDAPGMLLPDTARNRGRKNVATTAKVNTTVTATTAKVTGAKTIAATIKPGSFSIVNTPLKKDYDEVDCNYVDDTILTLDPELCCFGLTPLFSDETHFSCQLKNNLRPDWFYKGPSDNECVVQCMFESMNLLVDNTTINKDLVAAQLLRNKAHDRPIWVEIVSKAIDHCTTPEKTQYNGTGPGPVTCTPFAYMVLHCLHVQLYKNCPAKNLVGGYYCTDHLEFVKVCDFIPMYGVTKMT